jgi:hypothetical protein
VKILFSTYSSIGPVMETATILVDMPVLPVDQPIADNTVQMGSKIDVIATLSTTIDLERR